LGPVGLRCKFDRPVTVTGRTNVSEVREIIESDGRYMIRDIAKAVHFEAYLNYKRFLPDVYHIY
jgi:hypothetical protein